LLLLLAASPVLVFLEIIGKIPATIILGLSAMAELWIRDREAPYHR
jgi:hypothetical protein